MRILRRLLERATRRLVFRRRLPSRFGHHPLWVTPGAALAYLRPMDSANWRELHDFAANCVSPGDTVWDIGANLGVFSFCAAHCAGPSGQVLALEADPWLSSLIQRSATIPGHRALVEVLCAAAADANDVLRFEIPAHTRSGSHLSSASGAGAGLIGKTVETLSVLSLTLDWLAERRRAPEVLKIDVEGAELQVLRGAIHLLQTKRPRLLIEVFEAQADAVTEVLHGCGYQLHDFTGGWAGLKRVDRTVYNTLALPLPV